MTVEEDATRTKTVALGDIIIGNMFDIDGLQERWVLFERHGDRSVFITRPFGGEYTTVFTVADEVVEETTSSNEADVMKAALRFMAR